MYNIKKIRSYFPIIKNNKIYLDNASSTYSSKYVINNFNKIYMNYYSSYDKGLYEDSVKITEEVEFSRKIISNFINSEYREIIFTSSTTESINFISISWGEKNLTYKDNIIITNIEHHSNILPWIILSKKIGFKIKILKINKDGIINIEKILDLINDNTKLISIVHISNILGIINPIKKIISLCKEKNKNILFLIDGAQSITKVKIDVKKINCDFYVFSSHKIYSFLGTGVLYIKKNILKKINPYKTGGGIIKNFNLYKKIIEYKKYPWKFECGTINSLSIISLKNSINIINKIGFDNIIKWEKKIIKFSINKLKNLKNIVIYGNLINKIGILSFNIKKINSFDIGYMLAKENISIRIGDCCSTSTLKIFNIKSLCRISFAMYTSINDINNFIEKLKFILKILNN